MRRRLEGEAAGPGGELVVGEARGIEGVAVASHPAAVRVTGDDAAADVKVAVGPEDGLGRGARRALGRRGKIGADHAAAADTTRTEVVGAGEGAGRETARSADAFARQRRLQAANAAAAQAVVAPDMPLAQTAGRKFATPGARQVSFTSLRKKAPSGLQGLKPLQQARDLRRGCPSTSPATAGKLRIKNPALPFFRKLFPAAANGFTEPAAFAP